MDVVKFLKYSTDRVVALLLVLLLAPLFILVTLLLLVSGGTRVGRGPARALPQRARMGTEPRCPGLPTVSGRRARRHDRGHICARAAAAGRAPRRRYERSHTRRPRACVGWTRTHSDRLSVL